jgi:hypothetical protein
MVTHLNLFSLSRSIILANSGKSFNSFLQIEIGIFFSLSVSLKYKWEEHSYSSWAQPLNQPTTPSPSFSLTASPANHLAQSASPTPPRPSTLAQPTSRNRPSQVGLPRSPALAQVAAGPAAAPHLCPRSGTLPGRAAAAAASRRRRPARAPDVHAHPLDPRRVSRCGHGRRG